MVAKIVEDIWDELEIYTLRDDFILVTDKDIYDLYKKDIDRIIPHRDSMHIIESGEESKSVEELTKLYTCLINKNISRKGIILSLGGGVVGDLSGFAASTYKRGISYVQIPTTLLSQVDSSIGGKTGIDFHGLKNIIGSFHFPIITLIYTPFINTLPRREITSGLGEIIKYGLIQDYDFFKYIVSNISKIYNKNHSVLRFLITKSIEIKSSLYQEDKYDRGIRQKLNFGHTIGHGIESLYKHKKYNHGEAVILGMIYEIRIALENNLIHKDYYNEIIPSLESLIEPVVFNKEEVNILMEYMKNDKKNINKRISFCLPVGKGKVDIFNDIDESSIMKVLNTNIFNLSGAKDDYQ